MLGYKSGIPRANYRFQHVFHCAIIYPYEIFCQLISLVNGLNAFSNKINDNIDFKLVLTKNVLIDE